METLGGRIRKLRKAKGLTLQALAGEGLSKGMLSLIENGKAKPSMESLTYIVESLGIEVNELLEEIPSAALRELLQQAERLYQTPLGELEQRQENHLKVRRLIEPLLGSLPLRYESARLLELYSRALYYLQTDAWEQSLAQAESMYEELHLINHVADIQLFRVMRFFHNRQYAQALTMIQEAWQALTEQGMVLDPLKQLDFTYCEAVLYFAVDDFEQAVSKMNEAIAFAKEKRIFYRIEDLYRLASMSAMLRGEVTDKDLYIRKLRQYAEFADHAETALFADIIEAHYLNTFAGQYAAAAELLDRHLGSVGDLDGSFLFLEKGKALYGLGHPEEALSWFKDYEMYEHLHHPFDLAIHYEREVYMALIHEQADELESARELAEIAHENFKPLPDSPYKRFAEDIWKRLTMNQ
ncbi:helix-turn-helix domain-containing protein [Planococcus lenghuensis]|uniref:HTH cro/C1-type domain-containing protein n=1 Tax=Planococcus lenghuensis TaxID=2213202 RepID=A0A1Q2KV77_9BACL|nr:helix-turn-helix domain-containing protein [Planococcus lenghuensis]AQQ52125.1 hypothetical protein B0X71_02620 [Planococcus lenghuensis]